MKILDHFEEWAMSLMLLAMTTLAFMQVVRRYLFSTGFPWTLEVTMICFAFMIFLGISYGVRVGAHIGVDALVNLLSPQYAALCVHISRGAEFGLCCAHLSGVVDLCEQDDVGGH